jgi:UDP-3-O-[3-hydroxymyristoyl] glucosamine N-acyltransferase
LNRGAVIHPCAFVEPGATIGAGTVVDAFVYVAANVKIGDRCHLQPGAVIGSAGYGYEEPATAGEPWGARRPHEHGVEIEDDVHIGANACVDAGSWRPTRIRRGARIDNLVHVAHNVDIGENAMIVALAELSGSVNVGARAWVAPSAAVKQRLTIGADATVGLGAVVVKNVDPGVTVAGVPAKPREAPTAPPEGRCELFERPPATESEITLAHTAERLRRWPDLAKRHTREKT